MLFKRSSSKMLLRDMYYGWGSFKWLLIKYFMKNKSKIIRAKVIFILFLLQGPSIKIIMFINWSIFSLRRKFFHHLQTNSLFNHIPIALTYFWHFNSSHRFYIELLGLYFLFRFFLFAFLVFYYCLFSLY